MLLLEMNMLKLHAEFQWNRPLKGYIQPRPTYNLGADNVAFYGAFFMISPGRLIGETHRGPEAGAYITPDSGLRRKHVLT